MRDWFRSRRIIVVFGLVIGYAILVYFLCPVGHPAVLQGPNSSFSIHHDNGTNTLMITHSGGDTLTAPRTDRLYIRANETTVINWTDAGGGYPVEPGDTISVTFEDPTPGQNTTEIDVIWEGRWPQDPYPAPFFCFPIHQQPEEQYWPDRASLGSKSV